jgi:hypothetical protein
VKLTKPQTALFGAGMLLASPVLVPIAAIAAGVMYLFFALACLATISSVRVGEK